MREDRPRVAVVTGAARGIGAGIVGSLLERGLAVVATDVADDALQALAEQHSRDRERLLTVTADVAEPADWDRVRSAAEDRFGAVDVLVNNAAVSPKRDGVKRPIAEIELDEWEHVLRVNLTGAYLGIRCLVPGMVDRGWGRIVNVSSQAAHTGARVAGSHYGASKAALLGLTRTVAAEYGAAGITVNAVTPGRIRTPMADAVASDVNEGMRAASPLGRLGEPEDVGAVIGFLVSEKAGYVTGATWDVNGGSRMG